MKEKRRLPIRSQRKRPRSPNESSDKDTSTTSPPAIPEPFAYQSESASNSDSSDDSYEKNAVIQELKKKIKLLESQQKNQKKTYIQEKLGQFTRQIASEGQKRQAWVENLTSGNYPTDARNEAIDEGAWNLLEFILVKPDRITNYASRQEIEQLTNEEFVLAINSTWPKNH